MGKGKDRLIGLIRRPNHILIWPSQIVGTLRTPYPLFVRKSRSGLKGKKKLPPLARNSFF